jgi:2-polyprenyl-3-methyl-5-hydroxy-6-metoxy-1,4-benzoquinol methylase
MAEMFTEEFWDERYRTRPALWSGKPNLYLVSEAEGLTPGTALDVGAGEGADAIWLAARGWQVTAVDLSSVALERAAAHAAQAGTDVAGRISWRHEDITSWDPGQYDLVSSYYLHLPPDRRRPLFSRLARAVAPGGVLFIVGHHPSDLETTMPRPPMPELFYTDDELAADLDPAAWTILTSEARGRPATDPDGNTVTIHDTVFLTRRLP